MSHFRTLFAELISTINGSIAIKNKLLPTACGKSLCLMDGDIFVVYDDDGADSKDLVVSV